MIAIAVLLTVILILPVGGIGDWKEGSREGQIAVAFSRGERMEERVEERVLREMKEGGNTKVFETMLATSPGRILQELRSMSSDAEILASLRRMGSCEKELRELRESCELPK